MPKVNRVGAAFSTLPFDGIDSVANVSLHDDFITAADVADVAADTTVHSELTWNADETVVSTGPATITALSGVADHPGIVRLSNAADTGDVVSLMLGAGLAAEADGQILLDDNGVYVAAVVRINDVDAANVEFGLVGQAPAAPNSSAADVVAFAYEEADFGAGLFAAQVNAAGTDVEEAFTVSYVEGDWVLLEIYATDTDAYFRMTTEDGSETVHLAPAAMPTVGMRPVASVENVGAAAETLDIDAFHLRYHRRDALVGTQNDWLGA